MGKWAAERYEIRDLPRHPYRALLSPDTALQLATLGPPRNIILQVIISSNSSLQVIMSRLRSLTHEVIVRMMALLP
jgi:hypothetical protein